jgi:hypothetical protein
MQHRVTPSENEVKAARAVATAPTRSPALRTSAWATLMAAKGYAVNIERLSDMQDTGQPTVRPGICRHILRRAHQNGFSAKALEARA